MFNKKNKVNFLIASLISGSLFSFSGCSHVADNSNNAEVTINKNFCVIYNDDSAVIIPSVSLREMDNSFLRVNYDYLNFVDLSGDVVIFSDFDLALSFAESIVGNDEHIFILDDDSFVDVDDYDKGKVLQKK